MVRAFVLTAVFLATLVSSTAHAQQIFINRHGFRRGNFSFSLGLGYPYGGYYAPGYPIYGYPYGDLYGGYPYGTYYNPGAGYLNYYLPPIYAPAELAYGPQAMQRFLGPPAVDPFGGIPGGLDRVAAKPVAPAAEDARPPVRVSNFETRKRAAKFVELGDELFRAQRYHEALQKYKTASETAPDVAEIYFRQGHAHTATYRYELAAGAFKRGLAIGPEWAGAEFGLDSIYGDADIAKTSHLEDLARTVLERPGDSDPLFVLAVFLHYDGQADRADRLFQKIVDMAGRDVPYVRPFLRAGAPAARPPADRPAPAPEPAGVDA